MNHRISLGIYRLFVLKMVALLVLLLQMTLVSADNGVTLKYRGHVTMEPIGENSFNPSQYAGITINVFSKRGFDEEILGDCKIDPDGNYRFEVKYDSQYLDSYVVFKIDDVQAWPSPTYFESNLDIPLDLMFPAEDLDRDDVPFWLEIKMGANNNSPDSDGDGLNDGDEIYIHQTDPSNEDTDNDGLADNEELKHGTKPNNDDSDGDGKTDGDEVYIYHSNPLVADTDVDGLKSTTESPVTSTDQVEGEPDLSEPQPTATGESDDRVDSEGGDPVTETVDESGWGIGKTIAIAASGTIVFSLLLVFGILPLWRRFQESRGMRYYPMRSDYQQQRYLESERIKAEQGSVPRLQSVCDNLAERIKYLAQVLHLDDIGDLVATDNTLKNKYNALLEREAIFRRLLAFLEQKNTLYKELKEHCEGMITSLHDDNVDISKYQEILDQTSPFGLFVLLSILEGIHGRAQVIEISEATRKELELIQTTVNRIRDYAYRVPPIALLGYAEELIASPVSSEEMKLREGLVRKIIEIVDNYLKL